MKVNKLTLCEKFGTIILECDWIDNFDNIVQRLICQDLIWKVNKSIETMLIQMRIQIIEHGINPGRNKEISSFKKNSERVS